MFRPPADAEEIVMLADPAGGVGTALAMALADELVAITSQLADLAFDLGSDEATLRRHMTSIQAIDRITQAQLAIADVLRSTLPAPERLDAVTLETLAASLAARYDDYRRPGGYAA